MTVKAVVVPVCDGGEEIATGKRRKAEAMNVVVRHESRWSCGEGSQPTSVPLLFLPRTHSRRSSHPLLFIVIPKIHHSPVLRVSQGGGLGDEAIVEAAEPECIIPGQTPSIKLLGLKAFKDTIDLFVERYRDQNVSVVAGEVISEEYSLEYGTDIMEMHVRAVQAGERALSIDDLIATEGTLCAAIKLLGKLVNVNALSTKKKLAGLQLLQQ